MLPAEGTSALSTIHPITPRPENPAPVALPPSAENMLQQWQRDVMSARLAVLKEIDRLKQAMTQTDAIDYFVSLVKRGQLPAALLKVVEKANHRKGTGRTVSPRTLYCWIAKKKEAGNMGLVPEGPNALDKEIPAWAQEFLLHYRKAQKPSIQAALEKMANPPSYMQAFRFMQKFSALDKQRGRMTGAELKQVRGYVHRDKKLLMPLDVVVADGHSFKAYVAHPVHGKRFIPEVEGVIDVATRVCIGWSAGLAESAMIVADAFRHAVTVDERKPYGGLFAIWYTDLGSGNKAEVNSDPVIGILARIGATWQHGIAGNPQGRGVIERMQGSLWIRAAKELPTYRGKDMDELTLRRTLKIVDADLKEAGTSSLLLSWPQFMDFCDKAVAAYNNRPHSELPRVTDPQTGRRRHMSPAEMWQVFAAKGWKPMLPEPGELNDLFRPSIRRVTLRGLVELGNNKYFSKELEHYHSEEVIVEYDIHNPEKVWVRDQKGRMICEAIWNANSRDFFPKSMLELAREKRAQGRLKRLEDQAREIREEAAGVVDMSALDAVPMTVEPEASESVEAVIPEDCNRESSDVAVSEICRPIFTEEYDLYQWLLKHPDERSGEDEAWMLEFQESDVYKLLNDNREEMI
ncbi:MAG: Mu transposase C-terminal domain-containing protein [Nitrospiraceae bacterium]|nr:Mu transposase C-terminal domain-containing protein [Nitrospiraceae bacterium]